MAAEALGELRIGALNHVFRREYPACYFALTVSIGQKVFGRFEQAQDGAHAFDPYFDFVYIHNVQ